MATLDEAVALRESGIKENIILLGLSPDIYSDIVVDYDIISVVNSLQNAKALSVSAAKAGKTASAFIAIDTGMGRIGYLTSDDTAISDIKRISQLPNFRVSGLFSHMATADSSDKTYSCYQETNYNMFYAKLKLIGSRNLEPSDDDSSVG